MTGLEDMLAVAISHVVVLVLLFNLYGVCVKFHQPSATPGRQVGTSLLICQPSFRSGRQVGTSLLI